MTSGTISNAALTINAPAATVWKALMDRSLIKQYMFGSDVISDWKEGSPIVYKGEYEGKKFEDKGSVVKVEPEKRLVMTHWSPLSGTPDAPENYHTVTYSLEPSKVGTDVAISQDNNASEDERQQTAKFWASVLEGMKKLLEK